jgi:hypothetical protein
MEQSDPDITPLSLKPMEVCEQKIPFVQYFFFTTTLDILPQIVVRSDTISWFEYIWILKEQCNEKCVCYSSISNIKIPGFEFKLAMNG